MRLFHAKPDVADPHPGILEDLERWWKRLCRLPLAAPLLLVFGLGFGRITSRLLSVPDNLPVASPTVEEVPRIHLEALSRTMERVRKSGETTADYVTLYREHVQPVEDLLVRRGITEEMARRVAWPLVEESYRRDLNPALVLSVVLVESGVNPRATSSVGARGLMQVMPSWAGRFRGCGRDLYDIEDNICNGTSILAWYLDHHGSERQALLGYNGCVTGANTPGCFSYPDRIQRLYLQLDRELKRNAYRTGAAAAD